MGGAPLPLQLGESLRNEPKMKRKKKKHRSHTHLRHGIRAVNGMVVDNPGRDGLRLVRWRNLPLGTGILSHQLLLGLRSSLSHRLKRR